MIKLQKVWLGAAEALVAKEDSDSHFVKAVSVYVTDQQNPGASKFVSLAVTACDGRWVMETHV